MTAAVVALAAFGPLLGMFLMQQMEKPQYQYIPFVIAAFGWLLWQRFHDGAPRSTEAARGVWLDRLLLASSFILLFAAIVVRSPWGGVAALILLTAYLCRAMARTKEITNLWGIWVLLWLMMPLPFGWDQRLITKLQWVSSRISSFVLDAVGVNHLMEGNVLSIPGKQLFVDEACSGIISILSVVACAAIYAVVKNRSPLHLLLLAAVGVGWATVINVGRISTIAFIYDRWGVDWSSGASHEILSLVLFMITFLALLSSDVILAVLLDPVASRWQGSHTTELRYGSLLARAWDRVVSLGAPRVDSEDPAETEPRAATRTPVQRASVLSWGPVLLFAPLALLQGALFVYALIVSPMRIPAVQRATAVAENTMPTSVGNLTRRKFEAQKNKPDDIHGMYSRLFQYVDPDNLTYVTSFDFPFAGGWHELTECYVASGWLPRERKVKAAPADAGAWKYVEADFEKTGDAFGTVFFTEFDQYGEPLEPNEGWIRPQDPFLYKRNYYLETRKTLQVQVFVTTPGPLSDEQRELARTLLLEARRRFHDQISRPDSSTSSAAKPANAEAKPAA
jgi:exosortase